MDAKPARTKKRKPQKKAAKAKKVKKPKDPFGSLQLFRSSLLYQTKQFFENSTLHGVRYIAEEGRPFFEKFMWFCFVATGAVAAIVIIFSLWEKFQTNPTITGLDTDFHNQEVIFPTVMVCPSEPFDNESVHHEAYVTLSNYEAGWEQYVPFLEALTRLSYDTLRETVALGANMTSAKVTQANLRKLAFNMAVRCNATFGGCRYKDEPMDCCGAAFKPVYSEHGFCYSFNSRWIGDAVGEKRNSETSYLYETDKKWGLTFTPLRKSDVFVHSHNEISGWDFRPQVQWDDNFAIDFLISMKQTYTTEDARQLSIGQRKCIFPDEVQLRFYRNDDYTFSGCMKECRLRKCIKFCDCIPPFYAPPVPQKQSFCTLPQLKCVAKFASNITGIGGCQHCELGCHNTVYDIEKYSKVMATEDGKEAVVTIEYLTWPIIRYKREVLFGWVDLLVSFGGIAGLFLGFSLLSGVEIIYFFTMRACCMLYKNRDQLVEIEREKLKRPPVRYDLGLRPDLRQRHQSAQALTKEQSGSSADTKRNVITLSLVEREFRTVKAPRDHGMVLSGVVANSETQLDRRFEKMKRMIRPDFFRPTHVAPYSERIKPLDRNVVRTKDGAMLYHGYLP